MFRGGCFFHCGTQVGAFQIRCVCFLRMGFCFVDADDVAESTGSGQNRSSKLKLRGRIFKSMLMQRSFVGCALCGATLLAALAGQAQATGQPSPATSSSVPE